MEIIKNSKGNFEVKMQELKFKKKITTVAQEQFKMTGERIKELEGGQQKLYIYNMKNAGKKD